MKRATRRYALLAAGVVALAGTGFAALRLDGGGQAQRASMANAGASSTFRAPLAQGGDPFIFTSGNQYHLTMSDDHGGGGIVVKRSPSISTLLVAPKTTVYTPPAPDDKEVWGPEIYQLQGKWYLYYTATNVPGADHRLHVAEAASPLGPYTHKGVLDPAGHSGNEIGPSLLNHNGKLYLGFTGEVPDKPDTDANATANGLFLAPMNGPLQVGTASRLLAAGGNDGKCPNIREAQSFLNRNGRTWMVYSACNAMTPDYRLMLKSIPATANPLVSSNWTQYATPVFTRNDGAGVWGPGSNAFFKSPDGTQDWLLYHAKAHTANAFEPRTIRAQRIGWYASGAPNLGAARGLGYSHDLPSGDPGGGPAYLNDDGRTNGTATVSFAKPWNADGGSCGGRCFFGDSRWSSDPTATATIKFTGTRVAFLSIRGPSSGIVQISVDGGPETSVNLYNSVRIGEVLHYLSPVLAAGEHTLRIRPSGQKDSRANGAGVTLDRVEVYP